jgi:hypothetical protein
MDRRRESQEGRNPRDNGNSGQHWERQLYMPVEQTESEAQRYTRLEADAVFYNTAISTLDEYRGGLDDRRETLRQQLHSIIDKYFNGEEVSPQRIALYERARESFNRDVAAYNRQAYDLATSLRTFNGTINLHNGEVLDSTYHMAPFDDEDFPVQMRPLYSIQEAYQVRLAAQEARQNQNDAGGSSS